MGLTVNVEAEEYTIEGLVKALVESVQVHSGEDESQR
jgi:hypothetical protein